MFFKRPSIFTVDKNRLLLLAVFILFLVSVFFRFYNYQNRWGLASDQARDAIVATYASSIHSIPLIGPFSASGPFVFGPYMYWFLMLIGVILPFSFFTYWIGLSFLSSLMVFPMILIGKEIKNIFLGLILGLFTAISTTENNLATNLTASALTNIFSIFMIYFFIRSIKYSSLRNFFFLGVFVGLSINTHFQAIPLVLLLFAGAVISRRLKQIVYMLVGFLIPFIPLIIFDITNNFYETTNIIGYFFMPHAANLPNRWLTYVGTTWPQFWSLMIGGNIYLSSGIMVLTYLVLCYFLYKKIINKAILGLGIVYALIFILFRYFPGQLFGDFTAFLAPIILVLVVWALSEIKDKNIYLGYALIILVSLFTIQSTCLSIANATNYSSQNARKIENILIEQFPKGTKFSIYDYKYQNTQVSLPLILYLNRDKKLDGNGIKIGIAGSVIPNFQLNYFEKGRYTEFLYTLRNYSDKTLVENGWVLVDPQNVYSSVENWYKQ